MRSHIVALQESLEPVDIYNIEQRYSSAHINFTRDARITPRNKELVVAFLRDMKLQGLSKSRQLFYLLRFTNLGRVADRDFDQMGIDDIKHLVEYIQDNARWSENTKRDHKVSIKRFYKWLKGNDRKYPEEVEWIRTSQKHEKRVSPQDLVSEKELRELLQYTRNSHERAMLWVTWKCGLCVGELLWLRVKDVAFDEMGAVIYVPEEGKTGQRPVAVGPRKTVEIQLDVHLLATSRKVE